MRFLVTIKPNEAERPRHEAGKFPENFRETLPKMGAFNQTLINDGMLVEMGGLKPTSEAVRIDYSGAKPKITDGPFTETKELIVGFWLLEAPSREVLVERLKQCPFENGQTIEIRPLFSHEEVQRFIE
jgi:hypothetical protein